MHLLQHKVHIVILHILIVQPILVNVYQKINFVILMMNVQIIQMNHHVHEHVILNNNHYVNGHLITDKNFHGILVVVKHHHLIPVQALVIFFH
jgi:hypothetical protein